MQGLVPLALVAAPVALVAVYLVANFNRLVGVRTHLRESWADVEVELKRRYELIPNLVATVQAYAAHERAVLEEVTRLRNRAEANHGAPAEQAVDESALVAGLRRLFVVVEGYPQLKADAHFLDLQEQLALTEDRIAAARRFFNGNVRELNQLCEQFPTNLVAGAFGFERASYFELDSAAERAHPGVGTR